MAVKRAALALVLAAGCTDEVMTLSPVIDTAIDDADADAFSGLDRIEITIAHAGDDVNLASRTFDRGDPLEIEGVPFGDDLVIHLAGFDGDTQVAYGRSCAFKVDPDEPPPAPHVFFSRTQKFASTDLVPASRDGGDGVSFLGSGVFLGGTFEATSVRQIERFDPATGQLALVDQVSERTGAVGALIGKSSPSVVLIGGEIAGAGANFLELIEPNRPLRPINNYPDGHLRRIDMTATSLTDGRVIAIGGRPPGPLATNPPVATITQVALMGAIPVVDDLPRAVLAHPRAGHTATRLGDDVGAQVLIVGGVDAAGIPVEIAELFKPSQGELASPTTFEPKMIVARSRHAAARMPDGSVLIIGGVDAAGVLVRKLERFSFDAGFVDAGMLDAGLVDATVTPLPNGRYLIAGGRNAISGAPSNTAYIARLTDTGSLVVVDTDRLGIARAAHQAAALCDGTILITGGAGAGATAERYNPPDVGRR